MARIIKIRCNGPGKHVNELDLDKYTRPTIVVRGQPKSSLPERLVVPCQYCTEGKLVITRNMIEEMD